MTAHCESGMTRRNLWTSGASLLVITSTSEPRFSGTNRFRAYVPEQRSQELIKNYGNVNILMPRRRRARLSEINLTSPRLKSMEANSITKHLEAGATESRKWNFLIATDFRLNKHCIVCVFNRILTSYHARTIISTRTVKSKRSNDEKCKYWIYVEHEWIKYDSIMSLFAFCKQATARTYHFIVRKHKANKIGITDGGVRM